MDPDFIPNSWHAVSRDLSRLPQHLMEPRLRRFFADLPRASWVRDGADVAVMALSSLWRTAKQISPRQCEFFLECGAGAALCAMLRLQTRRSWLWNDQNYFVPFYCASVLGSLVRPGLPRSVMRDLLDDGVVDVLVPMARGSLTWLEAQQAARALCLSLIHISEPTRPY